MAERAMRGFWDSRAEEDAFYFVDNRLRYRDPDMERFWAGGREDLEQILAELRLGLSRDERLVEIGCGVGRITRALAARVADVRAIDVSPRMLELARDHNPELENVEWILGDGTTLTGIADSSAHGCFSHVVFQHIPDPQITLRYVREMGRVLRPGGWSAFQISNQPELHRRRPLLARLRSLPARLLGWRPRGQAHPAWLGSAIQLDELRDVADKTRLDVARVSGEGTQWCLILLRKRA